MPCDYSKYPEDWENIRRDILRRAFNACEQCSVPNHATIWRSRFAPEYLMADRQVRSSIDGKLLRREPLCDCCDDWRDATVIVLTVAHLDHDTTNNNPDNLRALCQACHLAHDRALHRKHAAETRRRKKEEAGQLTIKGGNE